jgi:hypothetical protein
LGYSSSVLSFTALFPFAVVGPVTAKVGRASSPR